VAINPEKPQARSLREHLFDLDPTSPSQLNHGPAAKPTAHERLFADASEEAQDLVYERWDGMS
jgi:hypothetical protein